MNQHGPEFFTQAELDESEALGQRMAEAMRRDEPWVQPLKAQINAGFQRNPLGSRTGQPDDREWLDRQLGKRPAGPGELCTCGRPAVVMYADSSEPTGWCGRSDYPTTACVFCGGPTHEARCEQYGVRLDEGGAR